MRPERKVTAGSGYILLQGYRQLFLPSCSLFLSFSSSSCSSFPLPCSSIFLVGLWKGGQRYNASLGHGGLCGMNAFCLGQQSRARGGVWNMENSGEPLNNLVLLCSYFLFCENSESWSGCFSVSGNWSQSPTKDVFESINLTTNRIINKIYTYQITKKDEGSKMVPKQQQQKTKVIAKDINKVIKW